MWARAVAQACGAGGTLLAALHGSGPPRAYHQVAKVSVS
jgi:hypothetical protein